MSLHVQTDWTIPSATANVARAAFPKGNVYMKIRDQLGHLYEDEAFQTLFRQDCGQSAYSPGQLALVSVMQFAEGLSDRQTADAVRGRIEWKYALGLELSDAGFDYSLLSEFRSRIIAGGRAAQLLDTLLTACKSQGWIKTHGKARTDSTHVVAAIRQVNQLECVGETLRHALEVLTIIAPDWLRLQVQDDTWYERYGSRIEAGRLPKEKRQQQQLSLTIGNDGHQLLAAIYAVDAPSFLSQVPAVETLRQVWVQRYWLDGNQVKQRPAEDCPLHQQLIESPYDLDARNRTKRDVNWTGYAVHLTETCEVELPNLIIHVDTTPATTSDSARTQAIHQALQAENLTPSEHFVDAGYMSAEHLVNSERDGIALVGPVLPDTSWQARDPNGLDVEHFTIDWQNQTITCPAHHLSTSWKPRTEKDGDQIIEVSFATQDCRDCPLRPQCTRSLTRPRMLKLRIQPLHQALTHRRTEQRTPEFRQRYRQRAGVEGSIAQACQGFDLRRSRYVGLAKTHLQHILIATAINFSRIVNWLNERPKAKTRISHFAALAASE